MNLIEMFDSYAKEKGFGPRALYLENIGFALYHLNDGECYLEDIYVMPERRRDKVATKIADEVVKIAKENGITLLTGSVVPSAKGSDISRMALKSYGFKLFETSEDFEKYYKEI